MTCWSRLDAMIRARRVDLRAVRRLQRSFGRPDAVQSMSSLHSLRYSGP